MSAARTTAKTLAAVALLGLVLAGCSIRSAQPDAGGAPDVSEEADPPAEPAVHPWASAQFDVAPAGEPKLLASGGAGAAARPYFWEDASGRLVSLHIDYGNAEGQMMGWGEPRPWFPDDGGNPDKDLRGGSGEYYYRYFLGAADGTGALRYLNDGTDASAPWKQCPAATAPPQEQRFTDVKRGPEGWVVSFKLELQQLETWDQCASWALVSYPLEFTRN